MAPGALPFAADVEHVMKVSLGSSYAHAGNDIDRPINKPIIGLHIAKASPFGVPIEHAVQWWLN